MKRIRAIAACLSIATFCFVEGAKPSWALVFASSSEIVLDNLSPRGRPSSLPELNFIFDGKDSHNTAIDPVDSKLLFSRSSDPATEDPDNDRWFFCLNLGQDEQDSRFLRLARRLFCLLLLFLIPFFAVGGANLFASAESSDLPLVTDDLFASTESNDSPLVTDDLLDPQNEVNKPPEEPEDPDPPDLCTPGAPCPPPDPPVPAPLPLLGLSVAFGFSRKLRQRLKRSLTDTSAMN